MTAFTKYPVGNKRFVIEWVISADHEELAGDPFEAVDCRLQSISARTAISSGSASPKLYAANIDDLSSNRGQTIGIPLSNASGYAVSSPIDADVGVTFPPQTRWYIPALDANSGVAEMKVSMLFEEII